MPKQEVHITDLNIATDKTDKFLDNLHDLLIKYDIDYSISYEINPLE